MYMLYTVQLHCTLHNKNQIRLFHILLDKLLNPKQNKDEWLGWVFVSQNPLYSLVSTTLELAIYSTGQQKKSITQPS